MDLVRPMLALPSTGSSNRQPVALSDLVRQGGWLAQEKLDGLRAVLYVENGSIRLFNRSLTEVTDVFPEIQRVKPLPDGTTLDGEIISADKMFSTVATRGKQTGSYQVRASRNRCYFVAFDLLRENGFDLLHIPLEERVACMRTIVGRRQTVRTVRQSDDILGLWEEVIASGGEGVIAKQRKSRYLPGKRASSWIKFKAIQRITAIAIGYQKGERRKLGAIHLALLGDGKPISIGRVGTGWTDREADMLQARLDRGDMFLVEIEALNRTAQNSLRFPVYRGLRTDLELDAATADQLAALPIC